MVEGHHFEIPLICNNSGLVLQIVKIMNFFKSKTSDRGYLKDDMQQFFTEMTKSSVELLTANINLSV